MKNSKFRIIIKLICFFLIGFIIIQILTPVFVPKWIEAEDNRISYITKGFYKEKKNSLDVLFMGNSDVYRGISPIVMWDEYGIASYNYVSSGQRMWTAYYMMEEALKYQKPKLIVLNMDSSFNETQSSESNYRKIFDNMKFGNNKIKAITDNAFKITKTEVLTYLFPILRFHSRWSELEDKDFSEAYKNDIFSYKGMDITTDIEPYNDEYAYMNKDDSEEIIGSKCEKYLNKMIELCKKNDVELLLIELPSAESWSKDLSDKTQEFADKNNLRFIDLNLEGDKFNFDWKTDTSDGGDHLNVYGAEKVSKYLGNILKQEYNIPNRKNDPNYESWFTDSEIYHNDIKKLESNN